LQYVSIDVETTGLNPEKHQILEIGAVWDNMIDSINMLPKFRCLVKHPTYIGDAFAFVLNHRLILELSKNPDYAISSYDVISTFLNWLLDCGWNKQTKLNIAGKNFGTFDKLFLDKLPYFNDTIKIRHRVIDPAILFWKPGDTELPDIKTCFTRAGLDYSAKHEALQDAIDVVKLVRIGLGD